MTFRKLLDLLKLIEASELPGAVAAVQDVQQLLAEPKWSDLVWLAELGDAVVVALDEGADVTRTQWDDVQVQKIANVRPKIKAARIAIVDLFDALKEEFGGG